jgi:hypothetical protein
MDKPKNPHAVELGKRSYAARKKRFGLDRLQEIARENGQEGGRPRKYKPCPKHKHKSGRSLSHFWSKGFCTLCHIAQADAKLPKT